MFSMRSAPKLHKESTVHCVSSAVESQLVNLPRRSQRVQEPLVTEAEDATPLEGATKQRSEERDWEH
jgi:hypothetical protein